MSGEGKCWEKLLIMNKHHILFSIIILYTLVESTAYANTEADQIELYKSSRFALGIGAAIVRFDTKLKFTDKTSTNFNSIFIDPEGNLDLPVVSHLTTYYGGWNINPKHSLAFSFFNVNRESSIFNIDKTFEDVRVVGDATISDATDFYQLTYGYTLFNDERSSIKFVAGIYGLDLKYVFNAEGGVNRRWCHNIRYNT